MEKWHEAMLIKIKLKRMITCFNLDEIFKGVIIKIGTGDTILKLVGFANLKRCHIWTANQRKAQSTFSTFSVKHDWEAETSWLNISLTWVKLKQCFIWFRFNFIMLLMSGLDMLGLVRWTSKLGLSSTTKCDQKEQHPLKNVNNC
jgi:hypothetical protein